MAVDNIDLAVNRGEVVGFLGPNGAGKSTTMKMLTGFLEPDSGKILINNIDLKSHPLHAKQLIGYLPEGAPSYSDMIVSDFLSFVGKMRGIDDRNTLNNRLEDMANHINLKDVWNRPIETLSKGFKRRVGLAQALVHDPKILILDEPTDGLDPNQKYEVRKLIKKLGKEKSIIISTHILEEVKAICNRTIILSNGKLLIDDTPTNVLKKSRSYNNLLVSVHEKSAIELKKELQTLNNFKYIDVNNNLCSIKLKSTSEASFLSNYLLKKKYAIKHYSINKGQLDEVFRQLTNTV